jgi:hypothetical protein
MYQIVKEANYKSDVTYWNILETDSKIGKVVDRAVKVWMQN